MEDPIRLLIVDDERPFLEALGERLELRGFAVTTAPSGEEALALCTDDNFDLALVDLKMAGMDGQELLARLKADHPDLEVIILTGHGSLRSAVDCTRLGAFGYLPKPYELDELLAVLRDAYAQRLRRRFAEREHEEQKRLEELIEAARYESPLGILRRMRKLDAGEHDEDF
jgi:DNA-binding NtrC family response regulator